MTSFITSLSDSFQKVKENAFSPFKAKDLNRRLRIVSNATKACNDYLSSISKDPLLLRSYQKKPLCDSPLPSTKILEALDLEAPILNSKSFISLDRDLYLHLKTPKNNLQAKALAVKVSVFTKKFLKCLDRHAITYTALEQIKNDWRISDENKLYLPRAASFFNQKTLLGDDAFSYSEPFAKGSMGMVRKLEYQGAVFANKEYFNNHLEKTRASFFREIGANLVLPPCKEILAIEAVFATGLILEYTDKKTLMEVKESDKLLPQKTIKKYLLTLASALEIIHSKGFVHTDVKLDNVLCFGEDKVKLGDLGFMKPNGSKEKWISNRFSTPPEKYLEGAEIEPSGDIWALGALGFSLLTKKTSPFYSYHNQDLLWHKDKVLRENRKDLTTKIMKKNLNREQRFNLSQQDPDGSILSLVAECMNRHIHKRPTAKELKERLLKELEA